MGALFIVPIVSSFVPQNPSCAFAHKAQNNTIDTRLLEYYPHVASQQGSFRLRQSGTNGFL
jgi:hypothetical protein